MFTTQYDYALTGDRTVLEDIKSFFESLSKAEDGLVILHDLRTALYGQGKHQEGNRVVCGGQGDISAPHLVPNGTLRFTVTVQNNLFESKKFLKALRRRFGKFRYEVLVDDTDLYLDRTPYTTDRRGVFFPHFLLVEGTPEDMEDFPYEGGGCNTRETTLATTKELVKALRRRGVKVKSLSDFLDRYPDLKIRNEHGEVFMGVMGLSSPGQTVPRTPAPWDEDECPDC